MGWLTGLNALALLSSREDFRPLVGSPRQKWGNILRLFPQTPSSSNPVLSLQHENSSQKGELFSWGAVVEEVRTVFARLNDATIYIPDLRAKELT